MNRILKKSTSAGAHGNDKSLRGGERDANPKLIGLALASTALFIFTVISDTDRSSGPVSASRSLSQSIQPEVHGGSSNILNIPKPFVAPWQYGLRAEGGYGGGWDEEVMMSVPQGDLQPLVSESVLIDNNREENMMSDLGRSISYMNARYYDCEQLLEAYGYVMTNQKRVTGGVPKPLQVVRAREDELPMVLNWGKPGGQRNQE